MAIYYLQMKTFGRGGGSSAVSAAAYRSGERIRDERTGRTYDHSARQDVMHSEIVLPKEFAGQEMRWARDRAALWNAAESAESRKNARVAREYLVALPVELSPPQRLSLARRFSQELTDRYGFAVDLAIHAPRDFPGSDPRNFHAHLLTTTREVTAEGLGAKTALDRNNDNRVKLGLKSVVHELLHVRERWQDVANEALQEANISARIDHRSLAAQGIDREPRPHIPAAAIQMERHGYRSKGAERLREEHEVRVQARLSRSAGRDVGREVGRDVGRNVGREQSSSAEPAARPSFAKPQSLEEIRREARENWLRLRQSRLQEPAETTPSAAVSRGRDDDLSR
jgi:hypothetical protein